MRPGVAFVFASCVLSQLICSSLCEPKKDGLYESILMEYHEMMTQIPMGTMKSCKGACEGTSKKKTRILDVDGCHCDDQCVAFGDCCLDYWQSCNSSFADAYEQKPLFECLEAKLTLKNVSTTEVTKREDYEVITRCPTDYQNRRLKKACEEPNLFTQSLPFVDGKDGRTYRNRHCADCHGVKKWKRWKTELVCSNATLSALIRKRITANNFTFTADERQAIRETCDVYMKPTNQSSTIPCTTTMQCKNKSSSDYEKCKSYFLLLYTMVPRPAIRNPHCARCEGMDLRMLLTFPIIGGGPGGQQPSLAILFDFSKASDIYGSRKPKKVEHECMSGEVYDLKLKRCRSQRIVSKLILKNWTCEMQNETFPNTTQHIVVFKNRSVYVPAHGKLYEPRDYRSHDGNITVCGNLTTRFVQHAKRRVVLYAPVEFYITLFGFSLSTFALLVVLITYALFSELRTLPGKIIMNLAVALLLSQLVFMVDMVMDVSGDWCTVIAVLLHYLYIAAFCWMNAMAFDVSRTFTGKSHRSQSGSRRKVFLFCLLYAWGVPLMIVGVTLAVNHFGALDAGYGNSFYCWLTNPIALAVFFAAPVVLMLLFNIVAIVRVLVAVRRVRKVTKKVRDKSTTGQDVRMCWKLTAVFGLTWILGLAAGYHVVIRIVYIICNSLQGVFIMIAFVMTRRILNLYLKKAGKEPLSTRSTAGTQKTTLTSNSVVSHKKHSTVSLMERKPDTCNSNRDPSEDGEEVVIEEDSPEAKLIASMEGPETKL